MKRPFIIAVIAMFSFMSFVGCAGKGAEKRERIAASANGKAAADGENGGDTANPESGGTAAPESGAGSVTPGSEGDVGDQGTEDQKSDLVDDKKRNEIQQAYLEEVTSLKDPVDHLKDIKNSQVKLKEIVVLLNQKDEQSGSSRFIGLSSFDISVNSKGEIESKLNSAKSKALGTFSLEAESAKVKLIGLSAILETEIDEKGQGVATSTSSIEIKPSINTNAIVLKGGQLGSELLDNDLYLILEELNGTNADSNGFKILESGNRMLLIQVTKSENGLGVQIEEGGDIEGNLIQSLLLKYELKSIKDSPSAEKSDSNLGADDAEDMLSDPLVEE